MKNSVSRYSSTTLKPGKTKAFFICLLIASFLWLVHSLNTVYTYTLKIPISYKNLPRSKKPLAQLPDNLSVELRASGLRLALILINKPFSALELDFNRLKSVNRNQNYVLSGSHLNFEGVLNFETQIKSIAPDTLYFSDKTGYQKDVPLKVPYYLKTTEGYGYKRPVVTPASITIWGDTSVIEGIDTVYTQPLTLNNLSKNVTTKLEILRPSPDVYTTEGDAHVFIEVGRLIEQTIFLPVADIHHSVNQQVNIYPPSVQVRFTSIQNTFNIEDTTLFKARIDSKKIHPRTKKCQVFLTNTPANVNVMEIRPKDVELLILKK